MNGIEIGWEEGGVDGEFLFDIPIELINNTDRLTIELLLPDAFSPTSTSYILAFAKKRQAYPVLFLKSICFINAKCKYNKSY